MRRGRASPRIKDEGNKIYASGNWSDAVDKYEEAILPAVMTFNNACTPTTSETLPSASAAAAAATATTTAMVMTAAIAATAMTTATTTTMFYS